jgi:hypothetical protein
VWNGWDGTDWEVYRSDGGTITQITDDSIRDSFASASGSNIVWSADDAAESEICSGVPWGGLVRTGGRRRAPRMRILTATRRFLLCRRRHLGDNDEAAPHALAGDISPRLWLLAPRHYPFV